MQIEAGRRQAEQRTRRRDGQSSDRLRLPTGGRRIAVAGNLFATALFGLAHAQTTPAIEPAIDPATDPAIEQVVVTAERREVSLQEVPVAISAFTAQRRDLMGVITLQDYTNFTPSFVYSSLSDRASLRGLSRLTNVRAVDTAVPIYIDGVVSATTVFAGLPPIETDRVEILRGPQGTLQGRNAIGGSINLYTPRPTDHPYAEARAIAENYGYTNVQLAASGPLADHLRVRIAGYKLDQAEGYYHNVNPGMPTEGAKRNEWEYQVQAAADLGDHAEAWIKYESMKWDDRGGPGARSSYLDASYETGLTDPRVPAIFNPAHGYSTATGLAGIVPGSLQQFNGGTTTTNPALRDVRSFNTNTPQHVSLDNVHVLSASLVVHAKAFDLKYIGGFQTYDYDLVGDFDGTNVKSYQIPLAPGSFCGSVHGLFAAGRAPVDCAPLTVDGSGTYHYFEHPRWFSNEVSITSTAHGPVQYIAGLYQYHEAYFASTPDPDLFLPGSAQLKTPAGARPNPLGGIAVGDYDMATESTAAFGQVDWKASETLKFTAGLRYTRDKKTGVEYRRVVCNSDVCYPALYAGLGLGRFGPATSANFGSLLGDLTALSRLGPSLGLGNALAGLAPLGNVSVDLTTALAPTSGPAGIKGVTDPVKCNAANICTQYAINPATGDLVRHLGDASDAWTGTLGVQWDPAEGTMAYGRYSRGYKAFGLAAGFALSNPEAKPEFVDAYEVGLKKTFGAALQLDAALYVLNYRDLQAPLSVRVGPTTATQFVNIARSVSEGLELDAAWRPIEPLTLMLDYSYDHTRIARSGTYVDIRDNIVTTPVSVVGDRLPQAPQNKVAVSGVYSFQWAAGTLNLSASYIYRGKTYANIFTRSYNMAPAWDQVDLRAGWASRDGKYTVIGYVRNLFDTLGYDAAIQASQTNATSPTGSPNRELTPPRTYGLELQHRFF